MNALSLIEVVPIGISMPTTKTKNRNQWSELVHIIAAIITFIGLVVAAIIQTFFGYRVVIAEREQLRPLVFWQEMARENGWIPKGECPWKPVDSTGKDKSGKSLRVRINILSAEYRWVFANSNDIELGGKAEDLIPLLRSIDTTNSKAIVCIGTASVEGNKEEQDILARNRADRLLALVRHELRPNMPLFGLNVGRFRGSDNKARNPAETAIQRLVIVLEILKEEPDVNRSEALFDALVEARESTSPIPFDVRDYYTFQLYQAKF